MEYAQNKVQGFKNFKGFNIKFCYEWNSPVKVITSFTYMDGSDDYFYLVASDRSATHAEMKYLSLAAGPAYRLSGIISLYGLIGAHYNKVNHNNHWQYYEGDHYENMGNTSGKNHSTSLM